MSPSPTTAHTPGPWKATKARKSSNFGQRTAFVQASGAVYDRPGFIFTVAKVLGGPRDDSALAEANARLIAAAPDLLAAVNAAADTFADTAKALVMLGRPTMAAACEIAERAMRDAIAKAAP